VAIRTTAATKLGTDPTRLTWKATLRLLTAHIRRDRVSVSAGSLAYHGFLAFFPAIIAALGVVTLVHIGAGTLHHLLHGIEKALPSGASGVLKGAVNAASKRKTGSAAAVVIGVVVALWSASSATAVLQQVLDVAYEVPTDRKFMARRLRGLPLLVLTGVLGGLAAALVVFGAPIGAAIRGLLPFGGEAFTAGWTAFRWVVALALISVLFSSFYAFAPNRGKVRWRLVTPGSLLAAAVFLLGSLGFSFYISTFGSYGKTYGSFAGVAIFIFWLYLTSLAVLVGGELNAELEREGRLRGSAAGMSADIPATAAGPGHDAAVAPRASMAAEDPSGSVRAAGAPRRAAG
jgi:membrane protein